MQRCSYTNKLSQRNSLPETTISSKNWSLCMYMKMVSEFNIQNSLNDRICRTKFKVIEIICTWKFTIVPGFDTSAQLLWAQTPSFDHAHKKRSTRNTSLAPVVSSTWNSNTTSFLPCIWVCDTSVIETSNPCFPPTLKASVFPVTTNVNLFTSRGKRHLMA